MRQIHPAKHIVAILTLLFATLPGVTASAQEGTFGSPNQFVLSAERLAGVYRLDANSELTGTADVGPATVATTADIDNNGTKIAFLGNDGGVDFSTIPRFGFDFFVIPNLSLGAAFIYRGDSDESDTTGTVSAGGVTNPLARVQTETSRSAFVISPRVGYGSEFADHLGIWARGGITYGTQSEEVDQTTTNDAGQATRVETKTDLSLLSLSLDVQLIIIPINHFGIGVGPFVEIPLTGSIDVEQNDDGNISQADGDVSATTFGLTLTLLGWL